MFDRSTGRSSALARGAVLALLLAVATACGGSSSPKVAAGASTTTAPGAGSASGFAAYASCLKAHGVDLGSGTQGPGGTPPSGVTPGQGGIPGGGGSAGTPPSLPKGVTQSQFDAAEKACASKRPTGGFGGGGGAGGQAAIQAYVSCLSDHGVKVTSSSAATTAAGAAPTPQFDRSDPKFAAANKVCRALLPSGATTTTTG